MPLKYALEEFIPPPHLPSGVEPNRWNSEIIYHQVSQEIAENDEERGVFCLMNTEGEQLTCWTPLSLKWVEQTMRTVKSTGTPQKDLLGELLTVGDYVALPNSSSELLIGKVIGFTDKKVRVLAYDHIRSFGSIANSLRFPNAIIKIQPTILSV